MAHIHHLNLKTRHAVVKGSTYQGGPPASGLDEVLPLLILNTYHVTNHLTMPRSRTRPATRVSSAGGQLASQEELCSLE